MKKSVSIILSTLMLASALVSCAPARDQLDPAITLASSDARANAQWLDERLEGEIPNDVVIGVGSSEAYGINMDNFENDGYIMREVGGEVLIFGKTETGLDIAVRKYAKAAQNGQTTGFDETYHEGVRVEKLTIDGNDIADYAVVYSGELPRIPRLGQSMANYIKTATGVTIPVGSADAKPEAAHYIYITQVDDDTIGETGCRYKVENGDVYIEGNYEMGVANGIYTFLEDQVGWNELYYGDSNLQEAEHIDVPEGASAEYEMVFDYLRISPSSIRPYKSERVLPIDGIVPHCCHGISQWMDIPYGSQMCHTSDNNYSNVSDKIYTYVDNQVAAGKIIGYDLTFIDISQTDFFGYCFCKDCSKVYKEEGKTESGAVVRFANRLAEDMESFGYGGIKYGIFAYHGSNRPCKTAPHDDVYVTFCTDGHCSVHSINTGECTHTSFDMAGAWGNDVSLNNADYAEWIKGWTELSDNIYIWYYALDNDFNQYTTIPQLYDDFKFFAECGVKGVYWQHPFFGLGSGRVDQQLAQQIRKNPEMTETEYWALVDYCLEKEYGDGWHYIRELINVWDEMENRMPCGNCWDYGNVNSGQWSYDRDYTLENWEYILDLLDNAKYMANSSEQEDSVEMLSVTFLYMGCAFSYFEAYDNDDTDRLALLNERYDHMFAILNGNGFDPVNAGMRLGDNQNIKIYGTLEEMAWLKWNEKRSEWGGYAADHEPRPMPQEWAEWYETSTAETSAS